jgi:hypothetical protein
MAYTDLTEGDLLYEGQVANTQGAVIRTGLNAGTVILPFGRAVVQAAASNDRNLLGLVLPVDANSVFMGVAVKTDALEKRSGYTLDSNGDMGWPVDHEMSYLVRGVIGVRVREAVTTDDPVFWIFTADTGEKKGEFRISANDAVAAVQITGARWLRNTANDGIAPLALNLA